MKSAFQEKAILLRKSGLSYSEILKEVPVSKSTLSLWLRSVSLAKKQKQRITQKKIAAMQRGWAARRQQRLETTSLIKDQAKSEITTISPNELWLMGIMLYWAEGSKSKEHNVSQGVIFSNSDAIMINLFLQWLMNSVKIEPERITFDIYIHESSLERAQEIKEYWAKKTGFLVTRFGKIYLKKNKTKTNRRNIGDNYFGLLRVKVKRSTNLNRKISGWIEAIATQCGVV